MRKVVLPLTLVCCIFSTQAQGQSTGQVGLVFKAQFIPQFGLLWHPVGGLGIRVTAYAEGNNSEIIDLDGATRISTSLLYRFPIDEEVAPYFGADLTFSNFEGEKYLGGLFGVQYQANKRFGIFGEVGISVDVDDNIDIVTMFNTGAGVVFYMNRR